MKSSNSDNYYDESEESQESLKSEYNKSVKYNNENDNSLESNGFNEYSDLYGSFLPKNLDDTSENEKSDTDNYTIQPEKVSLDLDYVQSGEAFEAQNRSESLKCVAEIIVIYTSIRASAKEFYDSEKVINLMNCKEVDWVILDLNKDVTRCSSFENVEFIDKNEHRFTGCIPEIIIDGHSIGGYIELLELEETGDLDYILARLICPECYGLRNHNVCENCNIEFCELTRTLQKNYKLLRSSALNKNLKLPLALHELDDIIEDKF